MALGLIFTGPVMSASADDQPITEGVASSESTQTQSESAPPTTPVSLVGEVVSPKTPDIQKETSGTPPSDAKVSQPTETTLNSPVTDSSGTTKPQNTSANTSATSTVTVQTTTERPIGTVLWEITSTTDDVFLTPQVYVTEIASDNVSAWNSDSSLKCGTKYQADAYYADQIAALKTDGVLKGGEDNGIALHWNVFTTAPCPVIVPPAAPNPHAFQLVTCGQDIVTVTNDLADAKDRLTASFVVYDNGKFLDALVALAGKPTVQSYTFPEDSGVHVITVRTGPVFGDVLLDTKTVLSDCKPAVVVPPVVIEPPVVTPPLVDAPVAPVTPPKAVLVTDKRTEGLAYTGSDPLPLFFGGGVLILLGIVGFAIARKSRTA